MKLFLTSCDTAALLKLAAYFCALAAVEVLIVLPLISTVLKYTDPVFESYCCAKSVSTTLALIEPWNCLTALSTFFDIVLVPT